MNYLKGSMVKVRDVHGRIVGKAKVGNYYPGTKKYHIEFLYPTGETEEIDVPGWCLMVDKSNNPHPVYGYPIDMIL